MKSLFQLSGTRQTILIRGYVVASLVLLVLAVLLGSVPLGLLDVVGAVAVGGFWYTRRPAPPRTVASLPSPGQATMATGGLWEVADPHQLIALPNTRHVVGVSFTPDDTFIATSLRAVLRATEIWWDDGEADGHRMRRTAVLAELPAHLDGPLSFVAGKSETWDLAFSLGGNAPSSGGDPEFVACEWILEFTIARRLRFDAKFVQPIIVGQPSARLKAGVIEESELSRAEESTASSGPVSVTFVPQPTPLNLASASRIDLAVRNGGVPISGNGMRLEVYVRGRSTNGDAREWVIWSETRTLSPLPLGVTQLRYNLPAVSEPCADMDLPHGWYRGALRFIVDIPYGPDVVVGRDLCLAFDKPALPSPAGAGSAGVAPLPAIRAATQGVDRPRRTTGGGDGDVDEEFEETEDEAEPQE
jgi:hypothetical protein